MHLAKNNPIFTTVLGICVLLFILGSSVAYLNFARAQAAKIKYEKTEQRLLSLLAETPAPTHENLIIVQHNVAALRTQVNQRLDATCGTNPKLLKQAEAPLNSSEMFFQLQAYRNQFHADAIHLAEQHAAAGRATADTLPILQIPPQFAFGFSRYITEPPKVTDIQAVHQQKVLLTYLLQKLYNSNPHSITAVVREPVSNVLTTKGAKTKLHDDEFFMDEHLSATHTGIVDTFAFKIEFTGFTKTLRSFLIQIEQFELPFVVRSVEVKSISGNQVAQAAADNMLGYTANFGDSATGLITERHHEPLITNNISRYSVIVEYIRVNEEAFAGSRDDKLGEDTQS